MISFLKGTILSLKPTRVVLDVGGVGYEVHIPLTTYEHINTLLTAELFIQMVVRENAINLYGFSSEEEKQMFSLLLSISGIGPSIGISILSSLTPQQIIYAVQNSNILVFTSIPGIGQSKSEKIVFELKRKLKKFDSTLIQDNKGLPLLQDAVDALVSLGFDEKHSHATVSAILSSKTEEITLESVIRLALKQMAK